MYLVIDNSNKTHLLCYDATSTKLVSRNDFHSEQTFVEKMCDFMQQYSLTWRQITHVIIVVGPGSIVGIRNALSYAKACHLSFSHIVLHTISTLDLFAYSSLFQNLDKNITSIASYIYYNSSTVIKMCYVVKNGDLIPSGKSAVIKQKYPITKHWVEVTDKENNVTIDHRKINLRSILPLIYEKICPEDNDTILQDPYSIVG